MGRGPADWPNSLISLGINGALGEIRTPDLLVRSQALYPTELQARGELQFPARSGGTGASQLPDDFSKPLKNQGLSTMQCPAPGHRSNRLPFAGRESYHTIDGI